MALALLLISALFASASHGAVRCADFFAASDYATLKRIGIHHSALRAIGLGKTDARFELRNGPLSAVQLELERENLFWFFDQHNARLISRVRPSQVLARDFGRNAVSAEVNHGISQVVQLAGPTDKMLLTESHVLTAPREVGIFIFTDALGNELARSALVTSNQATRILANDALPAFAETLKRLEANGQIAGRVEFIHSHPIFDIEIHGSQGFKRSLIAAVSPPDIRFLMESLHLPGDPIPLIVSAVVPNGYTYSAVVIGDRVATKQMTSILFSGVR